MPNEVIAIESELKSVAQEQRRLEEQIMEFRQRIHTEETWLKRNIPATVGYQQTVEEVLALEAYVEDLQAQLAVWTRSGSNSTGNASRGSIPTSPWLRKHRQRSRSSVPPAGWMAPLPSRQWG